MPYIKKCTCEPACAICFEQAREYIGPIRTDVLGPMGRALAMSVEHEPIRVPPESTRGLCPSHGRHGRQDYKGRRLGDRRSIRYGF